MPWLPRTFVHPPRAEVGSTHHLRPIAPGDVDLDLVAVLGSRDRLFGIYGEKWGWPPAGMTREQDLEDLEHHAAEMRTNESFNYALFDEAESRLLGCVYIDQPDDAVHDAVVSWWVVDAEAGGPLEAELAATVPRWLADEWPLERVRYGVWAGE
jgi:RimJ/RimL family protein N-acetyltransferase